MNITEIHDERWKIINYVDKLLVMLLLLNAADGFLTYIGVRSGYAIEANALMVPVVTDPVKLFLYKILIPSLLVGFLAFIIRKAKDKSIVRVKRLIHMLVWIYVGVLLLHAIWIWYAVYVIYQ